MSPESHIVFASHNAGKLDELRALCSAMPFELVLQTDLGVRSVEETGSTFIENALLKAKHAAAETGLPALADDSGLVVNALQGRPGVYSSRYAGEDTPYVEKMQRLLNELNETGTSDRSAYFICVLVYLRHAADPAPLIAQGIWQGDIAETQQGRHGFGYDPIFYLASECSTVADLPAEKKNSLSHRARAFRALHQQLINFYQQEEAHESR